MRRAWSFYNLVTGEFASRRYSASNDRHLLANTPDGFAAMEGIFDPLTQRVDVKTGEVVEWENTKLAEEIAKRDSALAAQVRINQLERSQLRVIRENELKPNDRGSDGKTAKERLQAIDDEIATLRQLIV